MVLSHSLQIPPSKNLPVLQESQVALAKHVLQFLVGSHANTHVVAFVVQVAHDV